MGAYSVGMVNCWPYWYTFGTGGPAEYRLMAWRDLRRYWDGSGGFVEQLEPKPLAGRALGAESL